MDWEQAKQLPRSNATYLEQFNSLKIISFRYWIVLFACVFALLSLLKWSFSTRVKIQTSSQTSGYTQPITLAFPALKRHLHQG